MCLISAARASPGLTDEEDEFESVSQVTGPVSQLFGFVAGNRAGESTVWVCRR